MEAFRRVAYSSRAIIYTLMGFFTLLVATGHNPGHSTDSKGVFRELLEHQFGTVLLIVLAIGLFCYAAFRLLQVLKKPNDKTSKIIKKLGYVFGALAHASLGVYALNLIFYFSKLKSNTEDSLAHKILTLPFGQVFMFVIALIIIAFGVSQLVIAYQEKFLKTMSIPWPQKKWLVPLCKFGLAARGVVFAIIGWFFLRAASHANSVEAGGIGQAWQALLQLPYGNLLTIIVAFGFIAFGLYGFTEAAYNDSRDLVR
jgi:hypothetical protein